jgi:hypothetical protein
MKGWRNGEIIPDNVLNRLSGHLNRKNASVIRNDFLALQESHHWKSFTAAEQKHETEHIEYFRKLLGNLRR